MTFEFTQDRIYPSVVRFFTNEQFGADLNQDASFAGTPEGVHNGTDTVLWTGSIESGGGSSFIFDSTVQANNGTKSIDARSSSNGNTALLQKPSGTISASDYVALSGFVYIESWTDQGTRKDVDIRLRNAGVVQGNAVALRNYISLLTQNSWQKFAIPLSDFGVTTESIDQVTLETIDVGSGPPPNYFLDDIQFEEQNDPLEFRLTPPEGKLFTVYSIKATIVAPWAPLTSDGSKPKIVHNKFMDIAALDNGLVVNDNRKEGVRFSASINTNLDLIQLPVSTFRVVSYDETNAVIEVEFNFESNTPVILDDVQGDFNSFVLTANLSSLTSFRISARGTVEDSI